MLPVTYQYVKTGDVRRKIPLITINIIRHNMKLPINTTAMLDSGATYSVFKTWIAKKMGVDYRVCPQERIQLGNGQILLIYLKKMPIMIGETDIDVTIGFSDQLGYKYNILGRQDIFNQFKICFDERNSQIIFYPPTDEK